jgi:hypothetical protein
MPESRPQGQEDPVIRITCPTCGLVGSPEDFEMSCADECFCPNGCEWFLLEMEPDDDEEDDDA